MDPQGEIWMILTQRQKKHNIIEKNKQWNLKIRKYGGPWNQKEFSWYDQLCYERLAKLHKW